MQITSARAVAFAGGALVLASIAGGAVSVASGVNSWSTAWTSEATLAAPWPMLLAQTAATVAAANQRRRPAMIGSVCLVLTAALSGISGFFDGQLGRADLGAAYVVAQIGYLVFAWLAVAAGLGRFLALRRNQVRAHP